MNERLQRCGELGEHALEGQHHANGELPAQDEPQASHQHKGVQQRADDLRDEAPGGVEARVLHTLRACGGLVAGPAAHEAVDGAGCLEGFYGLDAGHGHATELGFVAHGHAHEVGALVCDDLGGDDLGGACHQAGGSQRCGVVGHDAQAHQRGGAVDEDGRELGEHGVRHALVEPQARDQVSRGALPEELHGQVQHLP